jgi:hypothetical protein
MPPPGRAMVRHERYTLLNEFRMAAALRCAFAAVALCAGDTAVLAQTADIARNRAMERKSFSDADIARGLFAVAFGAEFNVAGRVDRIRRFEEPIRIYIDNRAVPDRTSQVAAVIEDIRSRVEHLDIAVTQNESDANVVVTLTRDRELIPLIRRLYGAERARQIQHNLEPQCLSGFRKDANFRIQKSDVLIVADVGDYIFFDCIYEELLQALGPINDDENVPWTMFNDEVQMGFFGVYDQYLLNIIYHPRIHAGMTRDQVRALLPEVMPQVRAFVAKMNNLAD